jgi:hypothetical protein
MTNLNIKFSSSNYKKIWKVKERTKYNWHDFIMYLVCTSELENKIMETRLKNKFNLGFNDEVQRI